MKHLISYKLFESISNDMLDDINDILIELEDMGFIVKTYLMDNWTFSGGMPKLTPTLLNLTGKAIIIDIETIGHDDVINIKDIKDVLLRINEYSYINNCNAFIVNDPDHNEDYNTIEGFIYDYGVGVRGRNVTVLQVVIRSTGSRI